MLQAMLLAGIVAAPLGSVALFLPARRYARRAGTWSAVRRFVLAVMGTVVLAVTVAEAPAARRPHGHPHAPAGWPVPFRHPRPVNA